MSWREDLAVFKIRLSQIKAQLSDVKRYVASGVMDAMKTFHIIDASSAACAMTVTPNRDTVYKIGCVNADNAVTVTLQGSWTFDGTNNIATFTVGDGVEAFADGENEVLLLNGNNGVVLSN